MGHPNFYVHKFINRPILDDTPHIKNLNICRNLKYKYVSDKNLNLLTDLLPFPSSFQIRNKIYDAISADVWTFFRM